MIFRQLFEPGSSTYSYLLGCEETGQAALIDPVLETVERDLDLIRALGLTLACTIETHIHADHVTGAGRLRALSGSKAAFPAASGAEFVDFTIREGEPVGIGAMQLRPLYTPGHTDDHHAYYVETGGASRVFTGDALLIDGCGRTDFQNGDAEALYHAPRLATRLFSRSYGDYVLSVGRIEFVKRVDLLVRAMAAVDRPLRLVVAGEGTQRANVERIAHECGVADRVSFLGAVDDEQLLELYADALAVVYPPFGEDFGYVTLEAFLARKPVITATDSGGPNEFVVDGVNGFSCEPAPEAFAAAINALHADRRRAQALGEAGETRARTITWDGVIERVVAGSPACR